MFSQKSRKISAKMMVKNLDGKIETNISRAKKSSTNGNHVGIFRNISCDILVHLDFMANLKVNDGLDVWSVGISLCELILLDAVLKPKYASIYRHAGSHRKAGFLFLEWLANPDEPLALDKKITDYQSEFVSLVIKKMLVKNASKRISLAECLAHPFISEVQVASLEATPAQPGQAEAGDVDDALDKKIKAKRRERIEESVSDKPPLLKSVLWKLNSDGDLKNKDDWLKRDMWLAHNGSMCYFSQKKGKRLVLLEASAITRGVLRPLSKSESAWVERKLAQNVPTHRTFFSPTFLPKRPISNFWDIFVKKLVFFSDFPKKSD